MKRMTFLTVLALVFSLFTVTAAIAAGPGSVDGAGNQAGAMDRLQAQTKAPECGAAECPAGEIVKVQTQTQTQTQTRTQAKTNGDACQAAECPAGEIVQAQTQTQARTMIHECQTADRGSECDPPAVQDQIRERVMERLATMIGTDAENSEYRSIFRLMWLWMDRFQALFL
jgi:hypothetical protein